MRRFVLGLFASIGIVAVLIVIGLGVVIWRIAGSKPSLPGQHRAERRSRPRPGRGAEPGRAGPPLLFGSKPTMRDFLDALERAGDDRAGQGALRPARRRRARPRRGPGSARRDRRLPGKGKFAIAFADSFGEFGPGTRPYYLATAFDEIWLQPLGIGRPDRAAMPRRRSCAARSTGSASSPSFAHREEYKSAMNILTETEMTPPQREEIEALLASVAGPDRPRHRGGAANCPEAEVGELIDRGPFLADEAKAGAAGRPPRLSRRGDRGRRATRAGSGAEFLSPSRYLDGAGHPHRQRPDDRADLRHRPHGHAAAARPTR